MCFPKICHPITSAYNSVCIDLIRYGFSETFFSLWSGPPQVPPDTSCVFGDFQNCYILLRFICNGGDLYQVHHWSERHIPQKRWKLGRINFWEGSKNSPN